MLGKYPIEATHENWLHNALVAMITSLHQQLDVGDNIASSQANWKSFVEATIASPFKENIVSASGIRDRFFNYKETIRLLLPLERQAILGTMMAQNQIETLLNGTSNIELLVDDSDVYEAIHDLFVFCYGKLTDFGVRGRQYKIIYSSLPNKICPFCGIHPLMHVDEAAQDQDHYLAKSKYPFAATNMKNLVPMCISCNRNNKKSVDVIHKVSGERRKAFNPYDCESPVISLINSVISPDTSPPIPTWKIDFEPANEEVETWDNVFQIRTRYKRDILGVNYNSWLGGFIKKCTNDRKRQLIPNNLDDAGVRLRLLHYFEDKKESPSIGMAGFLEPLAFEFLLDQFDQKNQRIVQLIRDCVLGIQIDEAA